MTTNPLPFAIEDEDLKNHEASGPSEPLQSRTALTARDVLVAARKLIERPENWCQGSLHRSRWFGLRMSYCMIGAVHAVSPNKMHDAMQMLRVATGSVGLAPFNDMPGRKHVDVLAAIDKAIELAGVAS